MKTTMNATDRVRLCLSPLRAYEIVGTSLWEYLMPLSVREANVKSLLLLILIFVIWPHPFLRLSSWNCFPSSHFPGTSFKAIYHKNSPSPHLLQLTIHSFRSLLFHRYMTSADCIMRCIHANLLLCLLTSQWRSTRYGRKPSHVLYIRTRWRWVVRFTLH